MIDINVTHLVLLVAHFLSIKIKLKINWCVTLVNKYWFINLIYMKVQHPTRIYELYPLPNLQLVEFD